MMKILTKTSKSSPSTSSPPSSGAGSDDDDNHGSVLKMKISSNLNGSIQNGGFNLKDDDDDDDDDGSGETSKPNHDPDYVHMADFDEDDDDDDDDDGKESRNDADFTVGRKRHSSTRKRSKLPAATGGTGKAANFKKKTNSSRVKKAKTEKKTKTPSNISSSPATSHQNQTISSNTISALTTPNGYEFKQILPPELLIRIFSMLLESEPDPIQTLIRLAQVCDHWRKIIITTPELWSRLDLSSWTNTRFPLERLRRLHKEHRLFSAVRHLDLSNWKGDSASKILEFITESIGPDNDLHSLSIRNCRNISNQFLQSVVTNAKNLRSLNVSRITASYQNCQNPFSTTTLKPLLELCGPTLQSLNMSENMMVSFSTCLSLVMEYCTNLEVLDISHAKSMGSVSVVPIEKLQQCCPKLRVLRAGNISFSTVGPAGSIAAANGWPNLEELSMPFNENFLIMSSGSNDQVIEQLTKTSENLQVLDIRGSPGITPRGLVKIPAWSLRHLSVAQCPKMQDDSLEMVFQKWSRSLVDIDLSWNKSETCLDACIRALCDVPQEELKLRTVDLTGSAISLETLRTLIMHCGDQLRAVDLQSCRSLPRGMKRLFVGQDCQQLRQIITERCD